MPDPFTYMYRAGKGFASSLARGRGAGVKREECEETVLDQATGIEWCVGDLVLDAETGDLLTPTEAEARAQQRGGRGADVMVWDGPAEEWVTVEEANRRREARQKLQEAARQTAERAGIQREPSEPGAPLIYPFATLADVFDTTAGEWVTGRELDERERQRRRVAELLADTVLSGARLPSLAARTDGRVTIKADGVAWVGDRPASQALADLDVDDEELGIFDTIKEALTGAEKRADGERMRTRLVILAALVAIVATIAIKGRAQ